MTNELSFVLTNDTNVYFKTSRVAILNSDFLQIDNIRSESIDLVVTSPPYNVGIHYKSFNDNIPYDEYLNFTMKWLEKVYELLKPDGRMCLNIPLIAKSCNSKDSDEQRTVYADITTIAKKIGFKHRVTIIWDKQNITGREAWGSWLSASAPNVIPPVEVIVVLFKSRWKKTSGSGVSDITKEEFIEWTNGLWRFTGEVKKIGHPAPFPIELPKRCIKLFSFVGDVVLDPFLGSGTTLLACLETNRNGIGVEIDPHYCELAKKRLLEFGIYPVWEFFK